MKLYYNKQQENDGWGYAMYLKNKEDRLIQKDWTLTCGKVGVINDRFAPIFINLNRCNFIQGPYTAAWMLKLYEVTGLIRNSTFVGGGSKQWSDGTFNGDGHPIYMAPNGSIGLEHCNFLNNGGNTQFVNRDWGYEDKNGVPMIDADVQKKVIMGFNGCTWSNNSWNPVGNGGGGASQLAIYNACKKGTDVIVTKSVFSNTIKAPKDTKSEASARAAITVWNEAWGAHKSDTLVGNLKPNADVFFDSFYLNKTQIRTTETDRSVVQINGTKNIVIENWSFDSIGVFTKYVVDIDPNKENPVRATKIDIEPSFGSPGFIRHTLENGDINVSPLSKGYKWSK